MSLPSQVNIEQAYSLLLKKEKTSKACFCHHEKPNTTSTAKK